MFKKIRLFTHIREFYKIFFSDEEAFIRKLSDMTKDNVNDVRFDIHEVLDANCYGDDDDEISTWLNELDEEILNFCEPRRINTKAIALLAIAVIALAIIGGYHMGRYHTIRQAELHNVTTDGYEINFGNEIHSYTFMEKGR